MSLGRAGRLLARATLFDYASHEPTGWNLAGHALAGGIGLVRQHDPRRQRARWVRRRRRWPRHGRRRSRATLVVAARTGTTLALPRHLPPDPGRTLRARVLRAGAMRHSDPDAPGRPRPRAPGAVSWLSTHPAATRLMTNPTFLSSPASGGRWSPVGPLWTPIPAREISCLPFHHWPARRRPPITSSPSSPRGCTLWGAAAGSSSSPWWGSRWSTR